MTATQFKQEGYDFTKKFDVRSEFEKHHASFDYLYNAKVAAGSNNGKAISESGYKDVL